MAVKELKEKGFEPTPKGSKSSIWWSKFSWVKLFSGSSKKIEMVVCDCCLLPLKFNGNTSLLSGHLRTQHATVYDEILVSARSIFYCTCSLDC